jgi:hypothetical protein
VAPVSAVLVMLCTASAATSAGPTADMALELAPVRVNLIAAGFAAELVDRVLQALRIAAGEDDLRPVGARGGQSRNRSRRCRR